MTGATYEIQIERVPARRLAAARTSTTPDRLGQVVISLLDTVWPALGAQGVRTDHNIVVYRTDPARPGELDVEAGVEVLSAFKPDGGVVTSETPGGDVVTTVHFGDYAGLGAAHDALRQWCAANGYDPSGPSWEVYGDWHDDPAQRRTDVYCLLQPGPQPA